MKTWLVVLTCFNRLEKYESPWDGLSHILWKIIYVWNHQPETAVFEASTTDLLLASLQCSTTFWIRAMCTYHCPIFRGFLKYGSPQIIVIYRWFFHYKPTIWGTTMTMETLMTSESQLCPSKCCEFNRSRRNRFLHGASVATLIIYYPLVI